LHGKIELTAQNLDRPASGPVSGWRNNSSAQLCISVSFSDYQSKRSVDLSERDVFIFISVSRAAFCDHIKTSIMIAQSDRSHANFSI
jgi:hypothetical protein